MMCPLQGTPSHIANEKVDRLSKNGMLHSRRIRFDFFPLYGCIRRFGAVPSAQHPCRSAFAHGIHALPRQQKALTEGSLHAA